MILLEQLFYKTFFKFNLKILVYFIVKPCLTQISLKVRSWNCTDYLKNSVLIVLQWYMHFGNISPISRTTSSQTNILYNIRKGTGNPRMPILMALQNNRLRDTTVTVTTTFHHYCKFCFNIIHINSNNNNSIPGIFRKNL